MRILIITQIFLPEMGALANRMYPIVRHLVAEGHEVFVATGMPNYPEGVVFPGYEDKRQMTETIEGCTVLRTSYFVAPRNQSKGSQLRNYLSFIPAALRSGLRAGPVDVVFVTSPPIFPVLAAIWLAKFRRAKLVFDIRDLWPDEIVAVGAARDNSLSIRIIRAIERLAYRTADCVSCTTQAFIETVVSRGVPRERTLHTPNGADLTVFKPMPVDNPVVARYPFGDRFVVMYSGLLGIKHGLETLIQMANLLRDDPNILLFLVGNGPRAAALKQQVAELGLQNVLFAGEVALQELPSLLARADVCVSTTLPEPYLTKIISVKIFEYMACEKPVIIAQEGESANVVRASGGGIVVPPADAGALADAVRQLSLDPARRQELGQRGRQFVEANYSREIMARRLEIKFREFGAEGKTAPVEAARGGLKDIS